MKKMIFEQIKRSLKKDTTSTIFLFSIFVLSITLMIFSISFCYETNNKQNKVEKIYQKNYYKMLISVTQRSSEISIFFKVYSFKYKLPAEMFKNSIDRITVYGFSKFSVKKLSIMNKNGRVELDKSSFSFIQSDDVLVIQNISIPLNIDTKVFLYPKNIF